MSYSESNNSQKMAANPEQRESMSEAIGAKWQQAKDAAYGAGNQAKQNIQEYKQSAADTGDYANQKADEYKQSAVDATGAASKKMQDYGASAADTSDTARGKMQDCIGSREETGSHFGNTAGSQEGQSGFGIGHKMHEMKDSIKSTLGFGNKE
ncbi:hypothetical protein HDU83_004100 [Entophlyctis luteolus]|nr:hypothetical protein HDU83_004100 [Entophlyctis luteolus]KAJ3382611.1 hypothetical protein HDU84_004184 [Entophlyctis sp. JEL0112]